MLLLSMTEDFGPQGKCLNDFIHFTLVEALLTTACPVQNLWFHPSHIGDLLNAGLPECSTDFC